MRSSATSSGRPCLGWGFGLQSSLPALGRDLTRENFPWRAAVPRTCRCRRSAQRTPQGSGRCQACGPGRRAEPGSCWGTRTSGRWRPSAPASRTSCAARSRRSAATCSAPGPRGKQTHCCLILGNAAGEEAGATCARSVSHRAHQNAPCSLPGLTKISGPSKATCTGSSGWIANGIAVKKKSHLNTKWAAATTFRYYIQEELRPCESNQQKCCYDTESEKHPLRWTRQCAEIRDIFDFFFPSFTSQLSPELCWTLHHLATGSGTTSHSSLACFRMFTNVDFPAAVGEVSRNNFSEKPPTAVLFN